MSIADPPQASVHTQTSPQPAPPNICVPLLMVEEDGKMRYCYHGGKCRCQQCEIARRQQIDELNAQIEKFVPHNRLKLEPPLRLAKPKQYTLAARYASPEIGGQLLKDHYELRKEYPTYYLPDKFYKRDAWKVPRPQDKYTQTEIRIGGYGVDGCPCVDKSICWDI